MLEVSGYIELRRLKNKFFFQVDKNNSEMLPEVIYHSPQAQGQIKSLRAKGRTLFIVDEWNRLIGVSGNVTQVGPHLAPSADHATIGLTENLIAKGLDDLAKVLSHVVGLFFASLLGFARFITF